MRENKNMIEYCIINDTTSLKYLQTKNWKEYLSKDEESKTLLHYACENNCYPETIDLLYKFSIPEKDKFGETPIDKAIQTNNIRALKILKRKSKYGIIHYYIDKKKLIRLIEDNIINVDVIQFLLEDGVYLNPEDIDFSTVDNLIAIILKVYNNVNIIFEENFEMATYQLLLFSLFNNNSDLFSKIENKKTLKFLRFKKDFEEYKTIVDNF